MSAEQDRAEAIYMAKLSEQVRAGASSFVARRPCLTTARAATTHSGP